MRISDWSSDVCSSDLVECDRDPDPVEPARKAATGDRDDQIPSALRPRDDRRFRGACGRRESDVARPCRRPCIGGRGRRQDGKLRRSEEHTSELQSLMRISYAVFCLKKKKNKTNLKIT